MEKDLLNMISELELLKKNIHQLTNELRYPDFNYSLINKFLSLVNNQKEKIESDNYNGLIRISVCGQFSCGKSAFLNSIIFNDQVQTDPILPSGDNPVTRRVTNLIYDNENLLASQYRFFKNGREITAKDYQQEAQQKGNASYEIRIPTRWLQNCVLSDTPGFDPASGDIEDRQVSNETNQKSDIIIFLLKITDGTIKDNSLEFLKQLFLGKNNQRKLLVVATFAAKKTMSSRESVISEIKLQLKSAGLSQYCDLDNDVFAYDSLPKDKHMVEFGRVRENILISLRDNINKIQQIKNSSGTQFKLDDVIIDEYNQCIRDIVKQVQIMKENCKRQYLLQNLPKEDWWCIDKERSSLKEEKKKKENVINSLLSNVGPEDQSWFWVDRSWNLFYDDFYIKPTNNFSSSVSDEHRDEMTRKIRQYFGEDLVNKYIDIWNPFIGVYNDLFNTYNNNVKKIDSEDFSNKSDSQKYAEGLAKDIANSASIRYNNAISNYKFAVKRLVDEYFNEKNKVINKREKVLEAFYQKFDEINKMLSINDAKPDSKDSNNIDFSTLIKVGGALLTAFLANKRSA